MNPVIFPEDAISFDGLGLGRLECTSCTVSETVNGEFDLVCQCAEDARHLKEVDFGSILFCKHGHGDDAQAFRVYRISAPLGKIVTIYAHHVSYDLSKVTVFPLFASSAAEAMTSIMANVATQTPFVLSAEAGISAAAYQIEVPVSVRAALVSGDGSAVSVFGGEMEWDNFSATLKKERGSDTDVVIRYGKNLIALDNDRTTEGYNAVVPFYADGEGVVTYASPRVVAVGDYTNAAPLDLSDAFDYVPAPSQLAEAGLAWLERNRPWESVRALKASALLEENRGLQKVKIGDRITVVDPARGINEKFRVLKTVYDALSERYTSIVLGHVPEDVADVLRNQEAALQKRIDGTKAILRQIANGTYEGGTFLDGTTIYAPQIYGGAELRVGANPDVPEAYNFTVLPDGTLISHGDIRLHGDTVIDAPKIRASSFSVYPADMQDAEYPANPQPGFNLFDRYDNRLYHMLRIGYFAGDAPIVSIQSPTGAVITLNGVFNHIGTHGFGSAIVTGLENSGYVKTADVAQMISDALAAQGGNT